jgi:hypothetical protein
MRGVVAESGLVSGIANLLSQRRSAVRGLWLVMLRLETAHGCVGLVSKLVEDSEE